MLNKTLITWGFSSTTFTGEQLQSNASWTVTIEKNVGHISQTSTGYTFGIGLSREVLNVKDSVGMSPKSYGIVFYTGSLYFAHNGKMDFITKFDVLPITVIISVNLDMADSLVITYKLEGQGLSLLGKRLIQDAALCSQLFPVFTVSQRVKLLFPTCV